MGSSTTPVFRGHYGRGCGSYAATIPKTCELDHIAVDLISACEAAFSLSKSRRPSTYSAFAGLIEHLVLPHLENAAACATNFAARAPPVTQDPPVRRAG